jgi:SnoaL-like domain
MSQENVEVARRAYAAMNERDKAAGEEIVAPDVEVRATGRLPDADIVIRGREAVRSWWAALLRRSTSDLKWMSLQRAATQILEDGFRESQGDQFFPTGVWLSDSSDVNDRAMRRHRGEAMLAVDVPDDLAQRFLAADFPGRWREFCIPAEIVNRLPTKRVPAAR